MNLFDPICKLGRLSDALIAIFDERYLELDHTLQTTKNRSSQHVWCQIGAQSMLVASF